jgi:hypothetical protein
MENVEAAFMGKHADNPKYKKYHRIYLGIEHMAEEINGKGEAYNPTVRFSQLLRYSKGNVDDAEEPVYDTPDPLAATNQPIITPLTPEQEKKAEQDKRLNELQEARKADKEAADSTNPDQGKAMDQVNLIKKNAAQEIKEIYNKLQKNLETAKDERTIDQNLLTSSTGDKKKEIDAKIKQLNEKITQMEQGLVKIKTEATYLIDNIENDNYTLKDTALAEASILRLHAIRTISENIENSYREKSATIAGLERQKTQEESLTETEINKAKEDFQKIVDIVGVSGKKALTREDIIKVSQMK